MKRSEDQINDVANAAAEAVDSGTKVPGMTYEQGVQDTIEWLRGHFNNPPCGPGSDE